MRFFVCCLLLCFLLCIPAYGAENRLPSGIGYEEIDAAIRDYIKEHEASTAGLAWSVFDEKEELSAGFYGYEDRENQLPVDEETVFEWGSGTKILVWVSVMQLYDEGQLDLEADIRTYLPEGFLSNLRYDTPVTMLHLMNHTAGFQYGLADVNIKQAGLYANLEEAVSAHKPEQIYEPGTITAYSNWGTSLAAYIVERISGMEFADYVHKHIFAPLGMERSALYMDLSDNGWVQEKRKELQCYTSEGELMQDSFDYITLYPSGRCVSTFGDFKALARAVLTKDPRIMSAEAWDTMFSPSDYFAGTELPKNYHGLWAVYLGVPAIGHIGRTGGSSCYLLVDPEHGVGSLFACNQGGDLVYTEGVRSLIYGDFQYEDFVEEPAIPAKTYRNASIDANGAFKLMAYISATAAQYGRTVLSGFALCFPVQGGICLYGLSGDSGFPGACGILYHFILYSRSGSAGTERTGQTGARPDWDEKKKRRGKRACSVEHHRNPAAVSRHRVLSVCRCFRGIPLHEICMGVLCHRRHCCLHGGHGRLWDDQDGQRTVFMEEESLLLYDRRNSDPFGCLCMLLEYVHVLEDLVHGLL